MTETRLAADAEKLLIAYLKADSAVAALVAAKVSTTLPPDFKKEKRVRLWRVGGTPDPSSPVPWLDRPRIQLEAYGTTKGEALNVANVVADAIARMPGTYADGVVTDTAADLPLQWSPDPHTDTPRYLFGAVLYVHPPTG